MTRLELAQEPGERVRRAQDLGVLEDEGDGTGARRRLATGGQRQEGAKQDRGADQRCDLRAQARSLPAGSVLRT